MDINESVYISIDFSGLEEIYAGSPNDLVSILRKIQQEYLKYDKLFEEFILAEDIEEFRKVRHKISATLQLLKLDNFFEYLTFLKEHFSNGFQDKEVAIAILQKSFRSIQEILIEKIILLGN